MSEQKQIIHIRIRDLRRERALTQEELAGALGISRQSINAMEAGRCLPSLPIALQIASFFSVPLTAVFDLPELRQAVADREGALVPWNPLQEALDELLDDASARTAPAAQYPLAAANVRQTAEHMVVDFYVPGFSRQDLDLEVEESLVTLSGQAVQGRSAGYLLREVSSQGFRRALSLPVPVRHDEAQADMKNGVLTVVIPLKLKAAPKSARISIRSAE